MIICISCTVLLFTGCFGFDTEKYYVSAEKLDYQPESYYNLSNETLNNYPKLKNAIDQPDTSIQLTSEEQERIYNFIFRDNDAKILKYNNSYYEINLMV